MMTTLDPQTGSHNGARAFEGDISALPVPELLQFINISGRDGVLVITVGCFYCCPRRAKSLARAPAISACRT